MTISKIPFDPADHEDFVAKREKLHLEHRLGGSDVGTAAGENKYHSRKRLFAEMTGLVERKDISGRQSIKDGILCEEIVAKKFEERTGKKVHRVNAIMTSDAAPHLFASIDRKVENEDAGLECKTANALNWEAFKDGRLPASYARQVKTYMKVTGYRTWYVYVWVMGCCEYCYVYTTDMDLVDEPPLWADAVVPVLEAELDECERIAADWFDGCIIPGIEPRCDGSEDETAFLKELSPDATDDEVIALTHVTAQDLDRMDGLKKVIKGAETEIAEIENAIKSEMGEHGCAEVGGRKITYRNNKPTAKTDWRAVCEAVGVGGDVIAFHTVTKPGARVLRIGK